MKKSGPKICAYFFNSCNSIIRDQLLTLFFSYAMDPFGSTLFSKQDNNVSMEIDAGNISLKKENAINLSFVQKQIYLLISNKLH